MRDMSRSCARASIWKHPRDKSRGRVFLWTVPSQPNRNTFSYLN